MCDATETMVVFQILRRRDSSARSTPVLLCSGVFLSSLSMVVFSLCWSLSEGRTHIVKICAPKIFCAVCPPVLCGEKSIVLRHMQLRFVFSVRTFAWGPLCATPEALFLFLNDRAP